MAELEPPLFICSHDDYDTQEASNAYM